MGDKQQFGEWEVIEPIKERSKRSIYRVQKDGSDKSYVLKTEPKHSVERIEQLTRNSYHPNLLHVIDWCIDSDCSYSVSEYCEMGTLEEMDLTTLSNRGKLNLCFQLFDGVEFVHFKGFVKTDNDPKNVFIKQHKRGHLVPVIGDLESMYCIKKGTEVRDSMRDLYPFFCKQINDDRYLQQLHKRREEYNRKRYSINDKLLSK